VSRGDHPDLHEIFALLGVGGKGETGRSKPPAHTLPLAELLARLKAQTNVRLVADATAPGGYRTELGPFSGWAEVPEWQP
jgi:hypothetical protein